MNTINDKLNKELNETTTLALYLLSHGFQIEHPRKRYTPVNELPKIEKGSSIAANIFLIKIPSYGININTPDWLIYLIDICAGGYPGYMQLIYKELLTFINNTKFNGQGITKGYTIKTEDFSNCFAIEFPITLNPRIYEKYSKMWDEQKIKKKTSLSSDNACDTAEYWLEVIERI